MEINGLKTEIIGKNDDRFKNGNELIRKIFEVCKGYEDLLVFNIISQICSKIALLNGLTHEQFKEFMKNSFQVAERDLKAKMESLDKKSEEV